MKDFNERLKDLQNEAKDHGVRIIVEETLRLDWKKSRARYMGFTFTFEGPSVGKDRIVKSLQITTRGGGLLKEIKGDSLTLLEQEAMVFVDGIVDTILVSADHIPLGALAMSLIPFAAMASTTGAQYRERFKINKEKAREGMEDMVAMALAIDQMS